MDGSTNQHQKLRIVCQILDEWLTGWSTVIGIVTEDLLCVTTGNVKETIVSECHSGRAINTTGFWCHKDACGVLAKIVSKN
jgi:hypothetical protein